MSRPRHFVKRAPRVDVRRSATVITPDGQQVAVRILDVSSGGFRLEADETLRIGEFVTLHADDGESVAAQIRWALGEEAGGVFLTPVDYSKFA
jgi:hypothetical protein